MEANKGSLITAAAIVLGFLILSLSNCSKKNDFESCFDATRTLFTKGDEGTAKLLAAKICSGLAPSA